MAQIERLATTPRGADPVVDTILDHTIFGALVSINPDGRVAGTRANANGFDMNRDYLIQSQPEMQISTRVMREWQRADLRRPARLLHARDDRRADQAAQRGGRVRPVPEVEPVAAGQDRGGARRRAATGCSGRSTTGARAGRCRGASGLCADGNAARAGRRRGPGRPGAALLRHLRRDRRPRRLHLGDLPEHDRGVELPRAPRRARAGRDHDRRVAAPSGRPSAWRCCATCSRSAGAASRARRGPRAARRRSRTTTTGWSSTRPRS